MYNLDLACSALVEAFCQGGGGIYHVGSSLERRDFRDVDVRCILPDEEFDQLFPGGELSDRSPFRDARIMAMNVAFSEWLKKMTGLPIDFQFQCQTQANDEYSSAQGHQRSALGMHYTILRHAHEQRLKNESRSGEEILREMSLAKGRGE